MSTSKEYREFVAEQLDFLGDVMIRPMMGEYLVYYQGKVIGGIYDNRVLVKITASGKKLMPEAKEVSPYKGAKLMLQVEELEDREFLKELILKTWEELPDKKSAKGKN